MNTRDRKTRVVEIGGVKIGGSNPVVVQSMCNTDTRDAKSTLRQIAALAKAGCELIRVAVPDAESAVSLKTIVKKSKIPVIADIHFDPKLALAALEAGVHGLRLNPGNIRGKKKAVRDIIREAADRSVPIRVGVNSGSVAADIRRKHGGATPQALVESAMEHINILEDEGFEAVKVSLKASDVPTTVEAYRIMAKTRDYPLHLGITEAGTAFSGLIKSSVGLGILLAEGLGDTIRVSLAADPKEEIRACWGILGSLGLRRRGVEVIACPTCARAGLDVFRTAEAVEKKLADLEATLRIAVMGCGVNGPGEARHADLGAVGTASGIQVFAGGKRVGSVGKAEIVKWLVDNARQLAAGKGT